MKCHITNLINSLNHFLQFIRTDVWTVCEPEIDQQPLAEEILTLCGFFVVVDE